MEAPASTVWVDSTMRVARGAVLKGASRKLAIARSTNRRGPTTVMCKPVARSHHAAPWLAPGGVVGNRRGVVVSVPGPSHSQRSPTDTLPECTDLGPSTNEVLAD